MNPEYTGKRIAELRKGKKLTQKELANKLHITDKAVSKWERGINFPDLGLMEDLAKELDTTPSYLLGLEEATQEEIETSFIEISSQQSEDAAKDIQKIGWMNLFSGIFLIIFMYFINIKLQLLFYRVMKPQWMKVLPIMGMICWLCWGILLKVSAAAWVSFDVGELIVYNVLPLVCSSMTWFVCRKHDVEKEKLLPIIKLFGIVLFIIISFVLLFGQDLLTKIYVKLFHLNLEVYAENLLDECGDITSDYYGFWKVTCYPKDNLVEFQTGGAGLVANSTYEGFYFSPNNTHKTFQGADAPINVNEDVADWYGEGDNWGKSTRILDKWFWFEAYF